MRSPDDSRSTYLDRIAEWHRDRAARDRRSVAGLWAEAASTPPARDFRAGLESSGLSVIAEIKRRSPSRGPLLAEGREIVDLARDYATGGAACLSVLTDGEHFGGSAQDLRLVRSEVGLPVLRKDFTVCIRDLLDARIMSADAVLLIVAILDKAQLAELMVVAADLAMTALVEVHDEVELEVALSAGAHVIGINQRDLHTFEVDQVRAIRVGRSIPAGVLKVAESGITGPNEAKELEANGFDAVLVGEHLVRSADAAGAVAALRGGSARR